MGSGQLPPANEANLTSIKRILKPSPDPIRAGGTEENAPDCAPISAAEIPAGVTRDMAPNQITSAGVTKDMAARRVGKEGHRDPAQDLDRFFALALDLLCIADTDGYFRRLNSAWEKLLGYTRAELMAKRFFDFIHPDDIESTQAAVAGLSAQREANGFINRYRCKDGTYRWLEWQSAPYGNLIYATARDITERKRAEEALRESENRYRLINDASPDFIYSFDREGRFTSVNRGLCAALRRDAEHIIGKKYADLGFADAACREWEVLQSKVCETGASLATRLFMSMPDGKTHEYDVTLHPLRDIEDALLGISGTSRDISDRPQPDVKQIRVSDIDVAWHPESGACTFERLPVAMMWIDTTLAGLMSGVQEMVGRERFILALESEGRKSVAADWQAIC